jgi:hypothetical protein
MARKLGWLLTVGSLLSASAPAAWASPSTSPPPGVSSQALAASLRGLMLQFLPTPLYEDHSHWDQKKAVEETKFRGKGLKIRAEKVTVQKNHGVWYKVLVTTPMLNETLVFDVRDLHQVDAEHLRFNLFLAFNANVDYDRQRWEKGLRLWSGSVRARMRVMLTLNCEVQTRVEKTDKLLPDMVFRLRVLTSDLKYDNLTVTHVPGIGGDLAQALGDGVHSSVKQLRPSLERKLLDKANAAIVKAADSKEVRVSLAKFFGGN